MSRRLRTAVPATALAVVLALAGCIAQPQEANDNGPDPNPVQPGDIIRTPVPVEEAPTAVPLPGESNAPNVEAEQSAEASPGAS